MSEAGISKSAYPILIKGNADPHRRQQNMQVIRRPGVEAKKLSRVNRSNLPPAARDVRLVEEVPAKVVPFQRNGWGLHESIMAPLAVRMALESAEGGLWTVCGRECKGGDRLVAGAARCRWGIRNKCSGK